MPDAVITSTTNSVLIDFNDQSERHGIELLCVRKNSIEFLKLNHDENLIQLKVFDHDPFYFCTINDKLRVAVDTVNGVAPSSIGDLFTKLSTLLA